MIWGGVSEEIMFTNIAKSWSNDLGRSYKTCECRSIGLDAAAGSGDAGANDDAGL